MDEIRFYSQFLEDIVSFAISALSKPLGEAIAEVLCVIPVTGTISFSTGVNYIISYP